MHAAIKCLDLLGIGHAACDEADAQAACLSQGSQAVADLHGQFASGNEHEALWLTRDRRLSDQAHDQRKAERQGLARPGLGTCEHVAASDAIGKCRLLDRERLIDAGATQCSQQGDGNAEFFKGQSGHGAAFCSGESFRTSSASRTRSLFVIAAKAKTRKRASGAQWSRQVPCALVQHPYRTR